MHEIVIAIKQKNLIWLHEVLMNVSNPLHEHYGRHLSRKAVGAAVQNSISTNFVRDFILSHNVELLHVTDHGEYIHLKGPILIWEIIFSTEFYHFQNRKDDTIIIRSLEYSIPLQLQDHIQSVFNTIQFPVEFKHTPIIKALEKQRLMGSTTTPSMLNQYYNIGSNLGSSLASQSIFQPQDNYYSPADLFKFESNFNIPQQDVANVIGGSASDSMCYTNIDYCGESNLDVQYIIGLSQVTPTTFWSQSITSNTFLSWILTVASTSNPPLVHSLSYGSLECHVDPSQAESFNTEAMKLGAQGISIIVSSGDDGAANYFARGNTSACGYNPGFPSTSPYVTVVGSTQGPIYQPEISASAATGGITTSSGGFSNIFTAPSYQEDAISNYFNIVGTRLTAGYNSNGRGYPDISFGALNYEIFIAGKPYLASGTSASSPAIAALVSLVNAKRLNNGKSALGFLNSAIYQYGSSFTNDITSSDNKCTVSGCCNEGFDCTTGWDPVTGWGSVDFAKFSEIFNNL